MQMAEVGLQRGVLERKAEWYEFKGGPFDGRSLLASSAMQTIVLPGACPPYENRRGDTIVPNHHIEETCVCPDEYKGPQEYFVRGGVASYVGQRPWPQTEDEEVAEVPPKLWTPGVDG